MADFGNLSKLYIAKQRLIQYNSKDETEKAKADVNGDGKVDEADLTLISRDINNAQTRALNAFDFNHDGKINQKDWGIFAEFLNKIDEQGDLDGDGQVSDAEKSFIVSQQTGLKSSIIEQLKKEKFTGIFENIKFVDGNLYTGFSVDYAFDFNNDGSVDDADWKLIDLNGDGKLDVEDYNMATTETQKILKKLGIDGTGENELSKKEFYNEIKLVYKSGVLCTGLYSGKLYNNGKLNKEATFYNNKLYVGGSLFSGTHTDGKIYQNGELFKGLKDNKYYEDGVLAKDYKLYKNKLYKNGVLVSGAKFYPENDKENQRLYVDGSLLNGFHENVYYCEGKKYEGELRTNYPLHDGTSASVTRRYGSDGKPANGEIDGLMYESGFLFTGTKNGKTYSYGVDVTSERNVAPLGSPREDKLLSEGSNSNEVYESTSPSRLLSFMKTVGKGDDSATYRVEYTYNDTINDNNTPDDTSDDTITATTITRRETNLKTGEVTTYTNVIKNNNGDITGYTLNGKTYSDIIRDSSGNVTEYVVDGVRYYNITMDGNGTITSYTTGSGATQEKVQDIIRDKDGNITSYSVTKGTDANAVKYDVILKTTSEGTERTETNKKTGDVTVYKINAAGKVTASTTTKADGTEISRTYNANGVCTAAVVTKTSGKEYSTEKVDGVSYTVITEVNSDKTTKKTYIQTGTNPKVIVETLDKNGQLTYKLQINANGSTTETTYASGTTMTGRYTISADGKTVTSEVMDENVNLLSKRIETETTIKYISGTHELVYTKSNGTVTLDGTKLPNTNVDAKIETLKADLYELISNTAQPKIYKNISSDILDVINKAVDDYMNDKTDDIFGHIVELARGNDNLLYAADMILKNYKKGSTFAEDADAVLLLFEAARNTRYGRDNEKVKAAGFDFSATAYRISTEPKYKALDAAMYKSTSAEMTKYETQLTALREFAAQISDEVEGVITPITTYVESLTDKEFYINGKPVKEADFRGATQKYYILNSAGNVVTVAEGHLKEALSTPGATLVTKAFYNGYWEDVVVNNKKVSVKINGSETKMTLDAFNNSYRIINAQGGTVTVSTIEELTTALANSNNTVVTSAFATDWDTAKNNNGKYYIENDDGSKTFLSAGDFDVNNGTYRLIDANGNTVTVTAGNLASQLANKNNTLVLKSALGVNKYVETAPGTYTKVTASFFGSSYYLVDKSTGAQVTNMSSDLDAKLNAIPGTYVIVSSALWQGWQQQVEKNNSDQDTSNDESFTSFKL